MEFEAPRSPAFAEGTWGHILWDLTSLGQTTGCTAGHTVGNTAALLTAGVATDSANLTLCVTRGLLQRPKPYLYCREICFIASSASCRSNRIFPVNSELTGSEDHADLRGALPRQPVTKGNQTVPPLKSKEEEGESP